MEFPLMRIARLRHDIDAAIVRDERVDQVHARIAPMAVDDVQAVPARTCLDAAHCAQVDRAHSVAHLIDGRNLDLRQRHDDRMTIEGHHDVRQHRPAVSACLGRPDDVVGIRVECLDDGRRDCDAGRQVDVERDSIARDRHASCLQILVELVAGHLATRGKHDKNGSSEAPHRRAALAA